MKIAEELNEVKSAKMRSNERVIVDFLFMSFVLSNLSYFENFVKNK